MTAQQPFRLIRKFGEVELRHYPDYVLLQVHVEGDFMRAGNVAFGPLISYISGANATGTKFAMTAPVIQESTAEKAHLVSFVLPEGVSATEVPVPRNSKVSTVAVAAHDTAVLPFSGSWNAARFDRKGAELMTAVLTAGLQVQGNHYFARFDPPWKPGFLKHNEALVHVVQTGSN
jgi:SOUL heme-binding protein